MRITLTGPDSIYEFNTSHTQQEILDRLHTSLEGIPPVKVYRVIDDAVCVLTTTDELKALRRYHEIIDANEKINHYGWIDVEDLQ